MNKGIELGLEIIKTQSKQGCESLKVLHHEINDLLFDLKYKYIDQSLANDRYLKLCDCGKRLSELKVPDSAKDKKTEVMTELRKRCIALKHYKDIPNTVDDVPQMQATINFFIHTWIEQKKKELTPEIVMDYLKESKRIHNTFLPFADDLNMSTLVKTNGEMLRFIEITYGLNHN